MLNTMDRFSLTAYKPMLRAVASRHGKRSKLYPGREKAIA